GMAKKLHAAGVEVILDVVYNHTNEADDTFPHTTSFQGIDNKVGGKLNKQGALAWKSKQRGWKRLEVKREHAAGVEVILGVVYNRTNEADDTFPYSLAATRPSFPNHCISTPHSHSPFPLPIPTPPPHPSFPHPSTYYIVQPNSYVQLANYAGCGNTLNCNHPVVMQMILDSLRHWVQVRWVDGKGEDEGVGQALIVGACEVGW
ncbi:unnamed protein product, partial [Closterium sp. NIES-53]